LEAGVEKNKARARELAAEWWKLDLAANSRVRGYAICDSRSSHQIPNGGGYLCNPSHMGDSTPDLVCEACFEGLPYQAWDGGYSGGEVGPYRTVDSALAALTPQKRWWQFWK